MSAKDDAPRDDPGKSPKGDTRRGTIDQVFKHQVPDPETETEHAPRDVYMVNVNQVSGCVFVKVLDFFRSQGGFKDDWGKNWVPIVATGIEDAREKGCALPGAKSYDRQAK